MPSLNKVFLMGNLTRNPELRSTPSGTSVCDLTIAVNRKYKLNDGNLKEETVFLDIVIWGHQAETAERYLQKGSPLFVEGRISIDTWEDKDRNKRSKYRIVAERIQLLGSKGGSQQNMETETEEYYGDESGMPPRESHFQSQQGRVARPYSANQQTPPPYQAAASKAQSSAAGNENPGDMPLPQKESPFEVDDQPGEEIPF